MPSINFQTNEVNFKIVYYGPMLSGKTINIQHIYTRAQKRTSGTNTQTPDSSAEIMLPPIELFTTTRAFHCTLDTFPQENGLRPRFHFHKTVGNIAYHESLHLVLEDVDGIIFVADSQFERMEANVEMMACLKMYLRAMGQDLSEIPMVIQYAKRDLPNATPIDVLEKELNPQGVLSFPSIPIQGVGVFESLEACAQQILTKYKQGGLYAAEKEAINAYLSLQNNQEQITPEETFALLRVLLGQAPSRGHWNALCAFLDLWPHNDTLSHAIQYTKQHTSDWPTDIKRLPKQWLLHYKTPRTKQCLQLVERIDIKNFTCGEKPCIHREWMATESLRDVKVLRLYDETFGDGGLQAFVDTTIAQKPVELALGEGITGKGAAALAASPKLRSVRTLDLNRNRIGLRGLRTLLQSPHLKHLKALHLGRNRLSYKHMSLFTEEIAIEALERLDLDHNKLSPGAIRALAKAPMLSTLQELNLSHNPIKKGGCDALADCEQLAHLKVLVLDECRLKDDDIASLIRSPYLMNLKRLILSRNQLTLKSIEQIANSPTFSQLEELDIHWNNLTKEEVDGILCASPHLKNAKCFCC
ncbi:MAG TPA: hypothetical protein DCE42_16405 [Myxococcales bacterium]|nr:hypothetical protein [Deltaproteobacteria bacterium]MBU48126.1 hypothetical protein [Deltaproteobacteria bacterium]HAA56348.1 hypothetical protein [Myxococcales bacterium]